LLKIARQLALGSCQAHGGSRARDAEDSEGRDDGDNRDSDEQLDKGKASLASQRFARA
jgi:hypothetical protein